MDTTDKLFSQRLRLMLPSVSCRLLDDLSERLLDDPEIIDLATPSEDADPEFLLDLLDPQEELPKPFEEFLEKAKDLSPAFKRAVDRTRVDEVIFLYKSSNVTTNIEDLANLLKYAIEKVSDYKVTLKAIDLRNIVRGVTVQEESGESKDSKIFIYYIKDVPDKSVLQVLAAIFPNVDLLLKKLFDEILPFINGEGGKRTTVHKTVHVMLPDSVEFEAHQVKATLHPDLTINDNQHYCSYIRTIIAPRSDPRELPFETVQIDHHRNDEDYREHRDTSVLTADADDPTTIPPVPPLPPPREVPESQVLQQSCRWARNILNCQIGFASSGGGASAYRSIALIERMHELNLPLDVFGGLSGGALIGAYFAADEASGLDRILALGEKLASMLPIHMINSEPLENFIDDDLNFARVGRTSLRFCPVTTEMRSGIPPSRCVIMQATMGQAVRTSGALPGLYGPAVIHGRRYTDGMASSIVPTEVVIDHGGDTVLACNCIPGPDRTNPWSDSPLGRLAYGTVLGRMIDYLTWTGFLTQNASSAYGRGCDVYFQFKPENMSSFEPAKWDKSYEILDLARNEHKKIDAKVNKLEKAWKKKCPHSTVGNKAAVKPATSKASKTVTEKPDSKKKKKSANKSQPGAAKPANKKTSKRKPARKTSLKK